MGYLTHRTRSRNLGMCQKGTCKYYIRSGSVWNGPYTYLNGYTGVNRYEWCDDYTETLPRGDHPFTNIMRDVVPLRYNGTHENANYRFVYDNYNPTNHSSYTYCPTPAGIDWSYYTTKALANMNPNKPTLDLGNALFELRDVPEMLHQLGRVLLRKVRAEDVAGGYLAWVFGWAPLLSDVRKLLNYEKIISDRIAYLRKLGQTGGGHIRRNIEKSSNPAKSFVPSATSYLTDPVGKASGGHDELEQTYHVWATAQGELLTPLPDTDFEMRKRAVDAAFGTFSPATIWNDIPWSWLVDFFVNVSDVLDAERGYTSYKISDMCVMATIKTTRSWVQTSGPVVATGGVLTTTQKLRSVSPIPTPRLVHKPFLTAGQLAILGDLALVAAVRRDNLLGHFAR